MAGKKSNIWTPANIVTSIRVVFVPIWLVAAEVCGSGDGKAFSGAALFVALFYMVLSLTDKLDGYLARSRNEVTTFGKFLDPIADKLVVIVSLCFLLEQGAVSAWVLLIIVAREFLVSGLRMVAAGAKDGKVIAANMWGKVKTVLQMLTIIFYYVGTALTWGNFIMIGADCVFLSYWLCWLVAIATAISGIKYLWDNRSFINTAK